MPPFRLQKVNCFESTPDMVIHEPGRLREAKFLLRQHDPAHMYILKSFRRLMYEMRIVLESGARVEVPAISFG